MSGKASRISELWEGVDPRGWDIRYAAYFERFNREEYYEAHDVLESLWLERGRGAEGAPFFQGLIQLAGAFVHLRKNFEHPHHRIHSQRLNPACRLLVLVEKNLSGYGKEWEGLALPPILLWVGEVRHHLASGDFKINPWQPKCGPRLAFPKRPRERKESASS